MNDAFSKLKKQKSHFWSHNISMYFLIIDISEIGTVVQEVSLLMLCICVEVFALCYIVQCTSPFPLEKGSGYLASKISSLLPKHVTPIISRYSYFVMFILELPWILQNYVMSERIYRKDEIGQRLLVVVNTVLLISTYFVWLSALL